MSAVIVTTDRQALKQKREKNIFQYPMDVMRKACKKQRIGLCCFNIVGDGETLLPIQVIELALMLLEEGHYVQITTNGTLTERIKMLVEKAKEIGKLSKLYFIFSCHWSELKRKNLMDVFFANVQYVHQKQVSFHVLCVLGEEITLPVAEEIKSVCKEKVGAYPQVAIARKDNPDGTFGICSDLPPKDYFKMGESFDSNLFLLDKKEFNHKREEFCYAGDWMFGLDFTTGRCWQCLSNDVHTFNFFENIDDELELHAVGNHCNRAYCSCCSFQAWGVMPEHEECCYLELYDRPEANWIKGDYRYIFSHKLSETNATYTEKEKEELHQWYINRNLLQHRYYMININVRENKMMGLAAEVREVIVQGMECNASWVKELIDTYGRVLATAGSEFTPHEDRVEYEKFYEKQKNSSTYLFFLGYLYLKEQMNEKAKELFECCLAISRKDEEIQASRELLKILG